MIYKFSLLVNFLFACTSKLFHRWKRALQLFILSTSSSLSNKDEVMSLIEKGECGGGGGWVGAKVLAISGIGISTFYGIEISTIFEIEIKILSSVMDWLMEWKGARALAFFGIGILIFDGIEISTIFRIEAKILNSILDWLLEWNILIPVCIDTPFLILTLGIYIDMHTHMTHDIVKLNESIICNGFNIMF